MIRKSTTVAFKATPEEKKTIEAHAKKMGMTVSAYLMALHNGIISNRIVK